MPCDGLTMACIRRELADIITGGRIDRVYQPSPTEILFSIYKHPHKLKLLISAHATNGRVHLTERNYVNPVSPPTFCMLLRKHLEGARIVAINQKGLERVLEIVLHTYNELGEQALKTIYCEVMGKHSNIILVENKNNTIVDGIKRYSHALSRYREVLPGRPYLFPPDPGKLNPLTMQEEDFIGACLNRPLDTALPALLQQVAEGLGLLSSRELVFRSGLDPGIQLNQCGQYELLSLYQATRKLARDIENGRFQPCLLTDEKGRSVDFAALELTHSPYSRAVPGINTLIDAFYGQKVENERLEREKSSLFRVIRQKKEHIRRKEEKYLRDAPQEQGEKYRLYGELVTANIHRLESGATSVTLENYYDSRLMEIPLDPSLSPAANAQRYFRLYTKARGASRTAQNGLAMVREEKEYLEGVENSLLDASCLEEIGQIREELAGQGYIREDGPKTKVKASARLFETISGDGFTILAGRNNTQNDYLTFRLADTSDIWLHARGIPGAHVVIRTGGKGVTEETIYRAAVIAAHFSKGRGEAKVPVDYTLRKYVRKPHGSRPGFVLYEQEKTMIVSPDTKEG